jgi:DNA invertase Pin-like site-specific DNA recombinase
MLVGYVRSLRALEAPFVQATRLIAAGCESIFIEASSGDHLDRPVLHRAIDSLKRGDVFIVEDEERLSRNDAQTALLQWRIQQKEATLRFLEFDTQPALALSLVD